MNKDAQCLNPQGLIGLVSGGQNASLAGPVNDYLKGMCSQAACSNATITSVFTTLGNGCQAEIASLGLGNITGAQLASLAVTVYPLVREVGCLEEYVTSLRVDILS